MDNRGFYLDYSFLEAECESFFKKEYIIII